MCCLSADPVCPRPPPRSSATDPRHRVEDGRCAYGPRLVHTGTVEGRQDAWSVEDDEPLAAEGVMDHADALERTPGVGSFRLTQDDAHNSCFWRQTGVGSTTQKKERRIRLIVGDVGILAVR